jgi:carnitine O-acetyltransferase
LNANPNNKEVMEKIESSSFVVCLDDLQPITRDQLCRGGWHGDGRNRFFDKPLQFIIFDNGRAAFNGEVRYRRENKGEKNKRLGNMYRH